MVDWIFDMQYWIFQVKQLYNIPIKENCVLHRKTKSCPLIRRDTLPSLDSSRTVISNLTPSTRTSPDLKSIKNDQLELLHESPCTKRPPSMAKLAIMVQNFLEPLRPVRSSMVGREVEERSRLTQSLSVPVKKEASTAVLRSLQDTYSSRDNQAVFKQRSFYLTTWCSPRPTCVLRRLGEWAPGPSPSLPTIHRAAFVGTKVGLGGAVLCFNSRRGCRTKFAAGELHMYSQHRAVECWQLPRCCFQNRAPILISLCSPLYISLSFAALRDLTLVKQTAAAL